MRAFSQRDHGTLRIAFFQDEMHWCRQRFAFIRDSRIDWIYTLIEPSNWPLVYGKHTPGVRLLYTIPGYVDDDLLALQRHAKPAAARTVDVGYRGRQLPPHLGRGAQEKHEIGVRFQELASRSGLKLDIESSEDKRIYGEAWHRFLGDCRSALGVEAGTSIFDIDDEVRLAHEAWQRGRRLVPFDVECADLLHRTEGNIYYRTVSPRHFEAAALGTAQILFPGAYSGILDPARHAILLQKDFSNFDDVLHQLRDPARVAAVAAAANRDLIDSGKYSYAAFIASFDDELRRAGLRGRMSSTERHLVRAALDADLLQRRAVATARAAMFRAMEVPFPGRERVRRLVRPLRPLWRRKW
jgi:hypothetical protein